MAIGSTSKKYKVFWIVVSMVIFVAFELFLRGVVGQFITTRFAHDMLDIRLQMLLMIASYFFGGVLVGLISPGIRIFEPAVGAALAVVFTWAYLFFGPIFGFGALYHFMRFPLGYMVLGSGIAFVVALFGADLGERIAARLGNRASRDYAGD
jgi:hypothetical protein